MPEFVAVIGDVLLIYAVPTLVMLMLIVFIHELGHFQVGRWCGVQIQTFSIGFGKELFGFNDKYGTRWKLSAIPLGGYVKFVGDENAASLPKASGQPEADRDTTLFHNASVWKRTAIVTAGPVATPSAPTLSSKPRKAYSETINDSRAPCYRVIATSVKLYVGTITRHINKFITIFRELQ